MKTKQVVVETLLNKMFEIAGHEVRYKDISNRNDNWYQKYTMTKQQNIEWNKWGTDYIKKEYKIPKEMAKIQMSMVDLNWGLKISDY